MARARWRSWNAGWASTGSGNQYAYCTAWDDHHLRRDLRIVVVGRLERKFLGKPMAQRAVELFVVPAPVGVRGHPPADVDVEARELFGQRFASSHWVEVRASEISALGVVDGVCERVALAELELVPDQVDEVELLGDGFAWPFPAASAPDQLNAGVDPSYVVMQVLARDYPRA